MNKLNDSVEDYVFGTLSESERAQFEAALTGDASLQLAVRELEVSLQQYGNVADAPPGPWKRLSDDLDGPKRFAHLVERLGEMFDLSDDEVQQILEQIDDESAWIDGMAPGVKLLPVRAGHACTGKVTALLKLEPGAVFPEHTHGDTETVLVLEGGYQDVSGHGVEVWRGEFDIREKGTSHSFRALSDLTCICASVTTFPE
jgi:putative transcriptional regulator